MIDILVQIIGYVTIVCLLLVALIYLIIGLYNIYDYWIKKLLGWNNIQTRQDIMYFVRNKKEIQDYLRNKEKDTKED